MKKLFLSLLVLCGLQANALEAADSLATAAQKPVPADTLAVEALPSDSIHRFEQPDSVTIRQFDDHLQVNIFGEKDNPDFRYQYTHKTSADDEVTNSVAFRDRLNDQGVVCTIRRSRGEDIFAACGMLAGKKLKNEK